MEATQVKDDRSLRAWLSDKPKDWAQSIALRAALRALPYIAISNEVWLKNFALLPLGAVITSWFQQTDESIFVISEESRANARFGGHFFDFVGYRKERIAAIASDASYYSADAQSKSPHVLSDCEKGVSQAAEAFRSAAVRQGELGENGDLAAGRFWRSVVIDCQRLTHLSKSAASTLTVWPLWDNSPAPWRNEWQQLARSLSTIDPNYSVWIDWYERRIRGERAAFDIPGDKGRIEDKKILRRLAEATDEDFWGKGHEYVNATLKGWLDEARERAAVNLPPVVGEASGHIDIGGSATGTVGPQSDPQDARSPKFGLDSSGQIAIRAYAGSDQLRTDPQSLSRHARALQMAQKLAEALRSHNNAGYITDMVNDYVAAMESSEAGPDPSGLIFAGDQLREAISKHRAAGANDDLQPLPPSADRDASAFLSAHNMYVGSDPFLDDLDRTTRGPDAPLPAADPDEIKRIVSDSYQSGILAERTYDYIVTASDAAPATYDQNDRHSRFAAGLMQNFARYGIELLFAYPDEAAWTSLALGIGATATLGPFVALAGAAAGFTAAFGLARNMIANEDFYRKLLATSPAGEDNFNRRMRFLKSGPFKSLKDD